MIYQPDDQRYNILWCWSKNIDGHVPPRVVRLNMSNPLALVGSVLIPFGKVSCRFCRSDIVDSVTPSIVTPSVSFAPPHTGPQVDLLFHLGRT